MAQQKGKHSQMSSGDPRMQNQTSLGRGETGRKGDNPGRSAGSFPPSEGIYRDSANESTSAGRWTNESDSASTSASSIGRKGTESSHQGREQNRKVS